jgi:ATP-dependent DNA ligase
MLFSRRYRSLDRKVPEVSKALTTIPRGTVVDGEVVALDDADHPDFNLLTHARNGFAFRNNISPNCASMQNVLVLELSDGG